MHSLDRSFRPPDCFQVRLVRSLGSDIWLTVPWHASEDWNHSFFVFIFHIVNIFQLIYWHNFCMNCWANCCWCIMYCFIMSKNGSLSFLRFGGAVFWGTWIKSCGIFPCASSFFASVCRKWHSSSPLLQPPGSMSFLLSFFQN